MVQDQNALRTNTPYLRTKNQELKSMEKDGKNLTFPIPGEKVDKLPIKAKLTQKRHQGQKT